MIGAKACASAARGGARGASRRGAASGRGVLPTAPRRPAQAMKVLLLCLADPMAATFLSYTAPETGHTLTVCTRAPGRRQSVDNC